MGSSQALLQKPQKTVSHSACQRHSPFCFTLSKKTTTQVNSAYSRSLLSETAQLLEKIESPLIAEAEETVKESSSAGFTTKGLCGENKSISKDNHGFKKALQPTAYNWVAQSGCSMDYFRIHESLPKMQLQAVVKKSLGGLSHEPDDKGTNLTFNFTNCEAKKPTKQSRMSESTTAQATYYKFCAVPNLRPTQMLNKTSTAQMSTEILKNVQADSIKNVNVKSNTQVAYETQKTSAALNLDSVWPKNNFEKSCLSTPVVARHNKRTSEYQDLTKTHTIIADSPTISTMTTGTTGKSPTSPTPTTATETPGKLISTVPAVCSTSDTAKILSGTLDCSLSVSSFSSHAAEMELKPVTHNEPEAAGTIAESMSLSVDGKESNVENCKEPQKELTASPVQQISDDNIHECVVVCTPTTELLDFEIQPKAEQNTSSYPPNAPDADNSGKSINTKAQQKDLKMEEVLPPPIAEHSSLTQSDWHSFTIDLSCPCRVGQPQKDSPALPRNIRRWFDVKRNHLCEPPWVTTATLAASLAFKVRHKNNDLSK